MSTTTNLALNEPAYNSTSPTWDQPLNYNATILDQMYGNTTSVAVSTSSSTTNTNIAAPSATASGSTSQAMRLNLTGALAANQNVLLPQSVAGMWVVSNNTTNAFTVTLGSNNGSNVSAGTTVLCPQNFSIIVYCDGANVKKADDGLITTPISVANGGTGLNSLAANNVILGNGTSAVQTVAPGSSGNILTSNGTTWSSQESPASNTGSLIRAPQILTRGTSYTTPAGCNNIYVEVVGGGGGGGAGTGSNNLNGGAGGGGGYAAKYYSGVSPSTAYTYAIAAGGAAASAGGSTSFTALGVTITANGGGAGAASGASTSGAGGSATNGDVNLPGIIGTPNGGGSKGGSAAGPFASGGGGNVQGSSATNGLPGTYYGCGGSGGNCTGSGGTFAGGAGFQGIIRITEYT